MNTNKIILVSWPSGSGKNTMIKKLIQQHPGKFQQAVSIKSRKSFRPGEVEWVSYHYRTPEFIIDEYNKGNLIEYAEFAGNYYATSYSSIHDNIDQYNLLKEIEPKGLMQFMESDVFHITKIIFMDVEDDLMRVRLINRDPDITESDIQKRQESAKRERNMINEYVYNGKLNEYNFAKIDGNLTADEQYKEFLKAIKTFVEFE